MREAPPGCKKSVTSLSTFSTFDPQKCLKHIFFYSVPIACFTMIGDNKRSHMLLTDLNIFLIREY